MMKIEDYRGHEIQFDRHDGKFFAQVEDGRVSASDIEGVRGSIDAAIKNSGAEKLDLKCVGVVSGRGYDSRKPDTGTVLSYKITGLSPTRGNFVGEPRWVDNSFVDLPITRHLLNRRQDLESQLDGIKSALLKLRLPENYSLRSADHSERIQSIKDSYAAAVAAGEEMGSGDAANAE